MNSQKPQTAFQKFLPNLEPQKFLGVLDGTTRQTCHITWLVLQSVFNISHGKCRLLLFCCNRLPLSWSTHCYSHVAQTCDSHITRSLWYPCTTQWKISSASVLTFKWNGSYLSLCEICKGTYFGNGPRPWFQWYIDLVYFYSS